MTSEFICCKCQLRTPLADRAPESEPAMCTACAPSQELTSETLAVYVKVANELLEETNVSEPSIETIWGPVPMPADQQTITAVTATSDWMELKGFDVVRQTTAEDVDYLNSFGHDRLNRIMEDIRNAPRGDFATFEECAASVNHSRLKLLEVSADLLLSMLRCQLVRPGEIVESTGLPADARIVDATWKDFGPSVLLKIWSKEFPPVPAGQQLEYLTVTATRREATGISEADSYAKLFDEHRDRAYLSAEDRNIIRRNLEGIHPIAFSRAVYELLKNPNPDQSRVDLEQEISAAFMKHPTVHLWVITDAHGKPMEMYLLPPGRVTIEPSSAQWPFGSARVQDTIDSGFWLDRRNVVTIERRPREGPSPLHAAAKHLDNIEAIEMAIRSRFRWQTIQDDGTRSEN